jgi:uncharacterized protein
MPDRHSAEGEKMATIQGVSFTDVKLGTGFWAERAGLIAGTVVPRQWKILNDEIPGAEPSHAILNMRIAAGLASGEFHGFPFQDSDVAKWLEAASYCLALAPDPGLEEKVERAIDLVEASQDSDGYIQSYFRVAKPGKRWTDLEWGHELYCGGHLIEAAVAHHQATGSRRFLDVMIRYVECVDAAFGAEPGKRRGYDGHPEIELALFRLYGVTHDEKHRALAEYFIDERGAGPSFFDAQREERGDEKKRDRHLDLDYFQAREPIRDQRSADGHAVRAGYLFTAVADYVRLGSDQALRDALFRLWESATEKRMYLTGGLGSQGFGERFSIDYDLPGDTAYAETCASIALVFWAWRMLLVDPDSRYADVLERALYNGVLSGMSADGQTFFYVNPLEAKPALSGFRRDHEHVKCRRPQWFGCACCPPNVARLVASISGYVYALDEDSLWVHSYLDCQASFTMGGSPVRLLQETDYPWDGRISLRVEGQAAFCLRLRLPSWCAGFSLRVNGKKERKPRIEKGYICLSRRWSGDDLVELELDMAPRFVFSRPEVSETIGKAAVQRGPFVLCAEGVDNGEALHRLEFDISKAISVREGTSPMGRSLRAEAAGRRIASTEKEGKFYSPDPPEYEKSRIALLPYFQWANREEGEMAVWLRFYEPMTAFLDFLSRTKG